jgi:phosphoglycerate kinase
MASFATLDDIGDVAGKRVLVRVDLNVPMQDGAVSDDTRLRATLPTVTELADKGAIVLLLAHFGRPKAPTAEFSLAQVREAYESVLGRSVRYVDWEDDAAGVAALGPGDVAILENTRFFGGEEKNDPATVERFARLGDIYVNDAFSAAHRAHASTEGLAHKLPAYAGRAMQAELEALGKALENPQRPVAAIVGGAKISTKLDLLGNLLKKVDVLIIGGAMANTFLLAQGHSVGKSLVERDLVPTAQNILADAKANNREIVLPVDAVVARKFEAHAPSRVADVSDVADDEMILDIGPRSIEQVASVLARSKTLVWNGPFGAFEMEPFDTGTVEAAEAAAELTQAGKLISVAGGGDTVAALNAAGVADRFTYVSTAGGAFLEWMEGKPLPGVEALRVK